MRRSASNLLVVAGLALLGAGQESSRFAAISQNARLLERCHGMDNSSACAEAIEAAQLKAHPRIKRVDRRLELPLQGGGVQVLETTPESATPDEVIEYRFIERLPQLRAYLCYVGYWEGGQALLVDEKSGARFPIDSAPVISPDGKRFATVSADFAAFDANAVKIFRVEPAGPALEWSLEPEGWGPAAGKWVDAATFRFQTDGLKEDLPVPEGTPPAITVHRRGTQWAQTKD